MEPDTLAKFRAFSDPAKVEARRLVLDYATKLVQTSDNCRANEEGYSASAANVKEASVLLKRRRESGGLKKLTGIVGGILAGHGLSALTTALQTNPLDRNGIILNAVLGVVGTFMVAVSLPKGLFPIVGKRKSLPPQQPVKVRRRPSRPREQKDQVEG